MLVPSLDVAVATLPSEVMNGPLTSYDAAWARKVTDGFRQARSGRRSQVREQDDLADGGDAGQEHGQAVDADAEAATGGQAVLEGGEVVLVDAVGLLVAGCLELPLGGEALAL